MRKFKKVQHTIEEVSERSCDWCLNPISDDIYHSEVRDKKWLKIAGHKMPPERNFGFSFDITGHFSSQFDGRIFQFDICEKCFIEHMKPKCRLIKSYMRIL